LHLHEKKFVISTVPSLQDNLLLIKKVKSQGSTTNVIVTALLMDEALILYDAGADYVLIPHHLGGEHAALILEEVSTNIDRLIQRKIDHIKDLQEKKIRHPHHL
jgi:hypothetical protein